MPRAARLALLVGAAGALTILTQVGGVVLIIAYLIAKTSIRRDRGRDIWRVAVLGLFAGLYVGASLAVVPPLARLAGRVPLPCSGNPDGNYRAAHPLYCAFNRNYVALPLKQALDLLSAEMARAYPGTVTLFLDASFPFFDGFPLLPHLSHGDGRKLDLAYYYSSESGQYLPGQTRSPIGYFAFEEPRPGDPQRCSGRSDWLTLRWDLSFLQPSFPNLIIEPERTRHALRWLVSEGPRHGIEKVFIEPYLAARLMVTSPNIRFQGCRAARHDDHIHFQAR